VITVRGEKIQWHENMTVSEALKQIGWNIPAVIVRVNGSMIKKKDWDSYVIPDDAHVDVNRLAIGG
jgi:thiamine biosynthesis protein ThiS